MQQAGAVEAADLASALGDSLRIVFGYAPGGIGGGEVRAQREAVEELGEGAVAEATGLLAGGTARRRTRPS